MATGKPERKVVDLTALGEGRPELLPHPGLETLLRPRADAEAIGLRCQLQQLLAAVRAGRSKREVRYLSDQIWMRDGSRGGWGASPR
jgi:hypothetical protein